MRHWLFGGHPRTPGGWVLLAGVLLLSPLLTAPATAKRINCGAPSTRTQRLSPLARGLGEASGLVASWQKHGVGWMIREGDNVEAGDYFPTGSCDVVMLSERRHVYKVFAG